MPDRKPLQSRETKRERTQIRRTTEYVDTLEEALPPDEENEEEELDIEDDIQEEETPLTLLDVEETLPWERPYIGGTLKTAIKIIKTNDGYLAFPTLLRPSEKVTPTLRSMCEALNEVLSGYFPFESLENPEELGVIVEKINRRFSLELGVEMPNGIIYPFSLFIPKGRPRTTWIQKHELRKWIGKNKERFVRVCKDNPFDKVMRTIANYIIIQDIASFNGLLHPIWRRLNSGEEKER